MAQRLNSQVRWWLAWALWFLALGVNAQGHVQQIPLLSGHVIDSTDTLTAPQREAINAKLAAFEAATGTQLVALIVATTAPEDITSFANRVGNAWKIGRKDEGDGLLLVVAKNDRKVRIEVAKTLEGAIPDLAAKQVIDQAITPRFKQGDFAGGIDAGIDRLVQLTQQENLPTPMATVSPANHSSEAEMDAALSKFGWIVLGAGVLLVKFLGSLGAVALTGVYWVVGYASGTVATRFNDTADTFFWSALVGPLFYIGIFVLVIALLPAQEPGKTSKPGKSKSDDTVSNDTNTSWWTSSSAQSSDSGSSSGFDSSSSDSSFSSGGGGDFGGGGASGDW